MAAIYKYDPFINGVRPPPGGPFMALRGSLPPDPQKGVWGPKVDSLDVSRLLVEKSTKIDFSTLFKSVDIKAIGQK